MPSEHYFKWYSHRMGREMEVLAHGHAGAPVLVFPSSWGRFYEWKDFLMIDTLADKINAGHIQLYGVDSHCSDSWYNDHIHPRERVLRHNIWESYIIEEVIPLIRSLNSNPYLITAGVSFGAYLAVNFAFRHPELVRKTVGLSGSYSIRRLLDGFYDEECYFNCPISYMEGLEDELALGLIRRDGDLSGDERLGPGDMPRPDIQYVSRARPSAPCRTGSTIGAARLFTTGRRGEG